MTFSKKVETNSGTGTETSQGDWDTYNQAVWDSFDVDSVTNAKGREVKTADVIGTVKFILELGNQPLPPASMKSNVATPPEGVDENSPEELARLEKFPNNWFEWVDEYSGGTKTTVRKVFWKQDPQETLVLAVDFPSLKLDYNLHPMATGEGEDIKPLRIDYNGKFKNAFERTITNEVHWKDKKFGDKDVKYAITSACGTLKEYQDNGHDIGYLVNATCNWEVEMTKNVSDGKTYYNTKIKKPSAIQDIKVRKDVYTVAEQLEDNKCDNEFVGIFFDAEDDHYSKEQLQQVRTFWWEQLKRAIQFDKNEGSTRTGTWLKGTNWEDSGLYRATERLGIDTGGKTSTTSSSQANAEPKQTPAAKSVPSENKAPEKIEAVDPEIDFDDDVPF